VIRQAISSLDFAAPPPVLSFCLLAAAAAAAAAALRCFAARCANENMPTFFCLAFDGGLHYHHPSPGMPSSSRRRTRHISAAYQRSTRSLLPQTHSPAHGPRVDDWSVHLARLPLSLSVCGGLRLPQAQARCQSPSASLALPASLQYPRTQTRASPQFTSPSTLSLDRPSDTRAQSSTSPCASYIAAFELH